MYVNGLRGEMPSAAYPDRLPIRAPGGTEIPDGPVAVPLSTERLEFIARSVRRWCAETSGPHGRHC
jgi:hypothetical protein